MEHLLQIKGLVRYYGYRRALNSIDLSLSANEILIVMGPNGAGKTTLLSSLISRSVPDEGEIHFNGKQILTLDDRRNFLSDISYLGHEPGLFYDLTAMENLNFFLKLHKAKVSKQDVELCETLLNDAHLYHRKNDMVRTFSRGMKQRLGLVRALLHRPTLLFFDEPLTGLDSEGEEFLIRILKEHKCNGGGAIVVTHSDVQFESVADRYCFIKEGNLVADIPTEHYNSESKRHVYYLLYKVAL